MDPDKQDGESLRSGASQNALSIMQARQRAEKALLEAKDALELKTRELAHSLSLMHAALESSQDGILVTDLSGKVTAYNQNFATMWRLSPEVMKCGDHLELLKTIRGHVAEPSAFVARIEEIYASTSHESFDVLKLADGRVFERYSRMQNMGGRDVGRLWNLRDITDRVSVEEELRQQREWFEVTLSSIGDAVITTDTEGRVTFLNPMAEMMTGWKLVDAAGRPLEMVFNIINERTRRPTMNPVGEVLREGIIVGLANHTILIAKDGSETAIEDSAAPIRDTSGKMMGVVMVFHDVTARRKSEDALRESEVRKAAILSAALDAIITMDHEGKVTDFNPAAETIFGYAREEAVGRTLSSLIIPEYLRKRHEEGLARYLATGAGPVLGKRIEMPALHADGHEFSVELSISRIGDLEPPLFTATLRDITSRKQAEEALVLSQTRLKLTMEAGRMGDWEWVISSKKVTWSPTLEIIHGLEPGTFSGDLEDSHRDMHPSDRERVLVAIQDSVDNQKDYHVEYRIIKPDGDIAWLEARGKLFLDAEGSPERMAGICLDVTARKEAEEVLRRKEEEMHALADSIPQLAWMAHPDGQIFWYNRRWYEYTGTTLEQMQGWGWQAVHDPKMLPQVVDQWQEALRTGSLFDMEFPLRGADGVFRWFLTRVVPVRDEEGRVLRWFGTNTNVDEVTRTKQELAAARDAAQSANRTKDFFLAALSHELRTPLTPVLAILSNLREDSTIPEALQADIERMRRNVDLEARLIDDLLDLTRVTQGKMSLHRAQVLVSQMIEAAIDTCEPELKAKKHTLVRDFEKHERINADATRITQIIWNLLRNSIKFTPPGGTITIRSRIISEGEDAGVLIEVQDTGMGIDPDSLDKIFDAFQQGSHGITHQFGGLGLGLAISKAIAESHQGRLAAVSEGAGRGCTFRLTLPFVESRNAESGTWGLGGDGRVETGLLEKPNWSERPARILLIEDHADSALVLSRLLRKTGHHVVHASSIAEALQLAESEMAAFGIDLVISDLGLPDGSGFSLMEDLSAKYGLRGIALSGYGMDADLEQSKAAGFTHHLVKPVDINDVRRTIFMMMKPR